MQSTQGVVQQFVPNALLAFGQPVNLRLYVLITSIAPLRAYVHQEGLVYHRHDEDKNYKKVSCVSVSCALLMQA